MMRDEDIIESYREAVAWMVHLTHGTATTEDVTDFKYWCSQDPAHARAFAEVRRLWEAVGAAGERVLESNAVDDLMAIHDRRSMSVGRRAFLAGALGTSAAAVGYAVIYPPLNLWPSLSEWTADYRTATGERRQITLANEIAIDMNTQTSIALRSGSEGIDRIELIAGEGLVQARSHSLEIAAASGNVSSASATFNIRRDYDNVTVTCLDGEVSVRCPSGSVTLLSRRQVTYSDAGLQPVTEVDAASVTSWREGFLVFRETALADVVREINRYRRGRIIVVNTALGRRPVNGRFYLTRLEEIVEKFQNAFGAHVTALPGGVVILS